MTCVKESLMNQAFFFFLLLSKFLSLSFISSFTLDYAYEKSLSFLSQNVNNQPFNLNFHFKGKRKKVRKREKKKEIYTTRTLRA